MTLQQLLWREKDADLIRDLAKYQRAINANEFPEMIDVWTQTRDMIDHEIEQRYLLAGSAPWQIPSVLPDAPF